MSPGYGIPRVRRTPDLDMEYRAPLFVIASGYVWSSHLLLLSASSRFPDRPQLQALRDDVVARGSDAAVKQRVRESLEEAGIESLPSRPDGRHVVADYLFVVGAPTLPTGGCTNGTLTFSALTLRSAEEIGRDLGWRPAETNSRWWNPGERRER